MADGLDLAQFHQFVGQQAQSPAFASLRGRATGQGDQVGFLQPGQLALLGSFRVWAPGEGLLESPLRKAPTDPLDRGPAYFDRLTDLLVGPGWPSFPLIGFA